MRLGAPSVPAAEAPSSTARPTSQRCIDICQALRLELAGERLNRERGLDDLHDPPIMFIAPPLRRRELQLGPDGGCFGTRPLGRLWPGSDDALTPFTRAWAMMLHHLVYEPERTTHQGAVCVAPSENIQPLRRVHSVSAKL